MSLLSITDSNQISKHNISEMAHDSHLHALSHCGVHATHEGGAISIEQRVADARQSCHVRGLRFTALREQVFRAILAATAPVGAYDILAQLQKLLPVSSISQPSKKGRRAANQQANPQTTPSQKAIAPPTVYRSLEFLLTHGFIHQLNSANAFIPCCHPREAHSVAFLICNRCGQVEEFSADSIGRLLNSVQTEADFLVQHSVIEIAGLCQQCHSQPLA